MLQAFRDHYCDAIETEGESEARFWLRLVGDEGRSLLREHIAAFAERIWFMKMFLVAPTLGLWQRRQTRGLALAAQLAMIAAVLLVWAPPLFSRVALMVGLPDLVSTSHGLHPYCLSAAVDRPTSSFITAFMQGTADIGAGELHAYHFRTSRVEISTFPLALAGTTAHLPAFLLDGEPAARLTTDLHVVQGDDFGDYQGSITIMLFVGWFFSAAVAGLAVFALKRVAGARAERQQPVITALRDRGAGRIRIVGALAVQALVLAGVSFLVGGLLADLAVRLVAAALVPTLAQQGSGGLFDVGLGMAGGIAAALTVLVAVLVMLRATSHDAAANG